METRDESPGTDRRRVGPDPLAAAYHVGEVFTDLELAGTRIEDREFERCVFESCDLSDVVLQASRFESCTFRACDLSMLQPGRSTFAGVKFEDSRVIGVNWPDAELLVGVRIEFERSVLDYSSFLGLRLAGLRMIDCRAKGANFSGANLRRAEFRGTDLSESNFSSADLTEADLSGATHVLLDPATTTLEATQLSLDAALHIVRELGIIVADLEDA